MNETQTTEQAQCVNCSKRSPAASMRYVEGIGRLCTDIAACDARVEAEVAGGENRNAHTCGRHCGTAYHPDAMTVRLIEQYEADHPTRRSAR